MGVVVDKWKIKWIIISFIFLSLLYGVQALFVIADTPQMDDSFGNYSGMSQSDVDSGEIADASTTTWIEFATFTAFDYPDSMSWFPWVLNIITWTLVAVNVYIVYAFAREILPLI